MAGQGKNNRGETCAECYNRNIGEILETLNDLTAHIIMMRVPAEQTDWGHAGTAEHINELLNEVAAFAGLN